MSQNPFGPDVVEAIKHHMNEDHADDSLPIVRALGGQQEVVRMYEEACLALEADAASGP